MYKNNEFQLWAGELGLVSREWGVEFGNMYEVCESYFHLFLFFFFGRMIHKSHLISMQIIVCSHDDGI